MAKVTETLKSLVLERMDMDDLIEHSAQAKHLMREREEHGLTNPEWLTDTLNGLTREIKLKSRDELEKRLRELRAQESGLETMTEKRERIKREREALEAKLGAVSQPA